MGRLSDDEGQTFDEKVGEPSTENTEVTVLVDCGGLTLVVTYDEYRDMKSCEVVRLEG